jgi:N-acetylmuramoyl-L-alanine amidase
MIDRSTILCHVWSLVNTGVSPTPGPVQSGLFENGKRMSELVDRELPSTSPFAGLRPSRLSTASLTGPARHLAHREPVRANRTLMATMPILLVGSLAMSTLGLAPLPATANAKADQRHRVDPADLELASSAASATADNSASAAGDIQVAGIAPSTYTVRAGDTVSGIAGRYGLSTASVLALNGLGWKSLIFPGQVLQLSKTASSTAPAPAPAASSQTDSTPATASFVGAPAPTTATGPSTPTAPPAAPSSGGTYIIQRGDTLTAIAKKFGVTLAAVLAANNLTSSSIIYAGRTLVIPGLSLELVGSVTVPLSPSMQANAQTIISVGRSLGVPNYGVIVALAAAAQESDLQNLAYGDRDSVGLFQQRPSAGWGTIAQLTTPAYAAALFYGGPANPNKGKTRGLLDIAGWQSMTVTQAAQAVQISGSPNAYAKWEASARAWLAQLG